MRRVSSLVVIYTPEGQFSKRYLMIPRNPIASWVGQQYYCCRAGTLFASG